MERKGREDIKGVNESFISVNRIMFFFFSVNQRIQIIGYYE